MTFEEVSRSLPNGFHDAELQGVAVDYTSRSAVISMRLLVGGPDDPDPEEYRDATLHLHGLCYCVIEPPDPRYPFSDAESWLRLDDAEEDPEKFPEFEQLLAVIPKGVTCRRFFVDEWNSFIHLAAMDVQVSW